MSMSKLRRLDISHTIHVIMLVIMTPYVVFTGHATSWPVFVFLLGGIWDASMEPAQSGLIRAREIILALFKSAFGFVVLLICDRFNYGELNLAGHVPFSF